MLESVLIANRGEIACRIIRTARRLGMRTIAVYSDADADALFVEMADEAHRIGPAPARDSYLRIDAIIEAAKKTGAAASIPATASCPSAPSSPMPARRPASSSSARPPSAIRAMGLKDAAKTLVQQAGVPVVPGYHGAKQEPDFLRQKAYEIGYPVLIKAVAGGGGKGMRRVDRLADFDAALESAQREAASAFGDPRVLVEKYILSPRHIEIQVFADGHGNVVHLFERDCSLQRRHQKVIEEAPAPGMTAGDARRDGQGRGRGGAGGWLCGRRHGRVHRRRPRGASRGPLLLHGDEHAAAGRAPGDGGDHGARSGGAAIPRGRRRERCPSRRTISPSTVTRSRRGSMRKIRSASSCLRPASCGRWTFPNARASGSIPAWPRATR